MSENKSCKKAPAKDQTKKKACKTTAKGKLSKKEKALFSEQNRVDMYPVDMNND